MRSRVLEARRLVRGFARKARSALGRDRTVYVESMVDDYRAYWRNAAQELGAEFVELADDIWEVRLDGTRTRINNSFVQMDDPVTLVAAADKPLCYEMARAAGVPIPEHRVFTLATIDDARRFMAEHSGPFVVKPARGTSAAGGVSTSVEKSDLVSAAVLASTYDRRAIVERMITGETYRLLYLDGEFVHAVRRRGLRIDGTGKDSILQLLHRRGVTRPQADELMMATLRRQGLDLGSVPEAGVPVVARGVAVEVGDREPRTVYDEVAGDLTEDVIASGGRLVAALDLEFAGVDVVTSDPTRSLEEAGGVVLEVNGTPALHHHLVPAAPDEGLALTVKILARLLEHPSRP